MTPFPAPAPASAVLGPVKARTSGPSGPAGAPPGQRLRSSGSIWQLRKRADRTAAQIGVSHASRVPRPPNRTLMVARTAARPATRYRAYGVGLSMYGGNAAWSPSYPWAPGGPATAGWPGWGSWSRRVRMLRHWFCRRLARSGSSAATGVPRVPHTGCGRWAGDAGLRGQTAQRWRFPGGPCAWSRRHRCVRGTQVPATGGPGQCAPRPAEFVRGRQSAWGCRCRSGWCKRSVTRSYGFCPAGPRSMAGISSAAPAGRGWPPGGWHLPARVQDSGQFAVFFRRLRRRRRTCFLPD